MDESADRSAQGEAKQAFNTAAGTAGQYGSTAGQVGAELIPTLERDINSPTGFTPTQINNQLVASEQGAGGATAGVTGAAGLNAMRTRNSAGLSGVLDQVARTRQQALSQNALNIQNRSDMLAQDKRASALRQLQGIYGTDVGAQLHAMSQEAPDINAQVNAGNSGWYQNVLGGINAVTNAYKAFNPGGGGSNPAPWIPAY
jgi:hypothetical protein